MRGDMPMIILIVGIFSCEKRFCCYYFVDSDLYVLYF